MAFSWGHRKFYWLDLSRSYFSWTHNSSKDSVSLFFYVIKAGVKLTVSVCSTISDFLSLVNYYNQTDIRKANFLFFQNFLVTSFLLTCHAFGKSVFLVFVYWLTIANLSLYKTMLVYTTFKVQTCLIFFGFLCLFYVFPSILVFNFCSLPWLFVMWSTCMYLLWSNFLMHLISDDSKWSWHDWKW